jgi:hypothetical protein
MATRSLQGYTRYVVVVYQERGFFDKTKGEGTLNKYESTPKKFRVTCHKCGSFVYNVLPDGNVAVPLGGLVFPANAKRITPAMHIFYAERRSDVHDELPKHEGWPN